MIVEGAATDYKNLTRIISEPFVQSWNSWLLLEFPKVRKKWGQVSLAVARASAKKHLEKSIELNPNLPTARHLYGAYLCTVLGRHDEAIAEAGKGLELDPLSLPINHVVGFLQLMARRPDDAIIQFRKRLNSIPASTRAS